METSKITPKDFFLWAGVMVAFYWAVIAFIFLLISYIDYTFPNVLTYYPADPYQSGISYQMASVIVMFPLFLWLMHIVRAGIASDPSRREIWVRRWALILTLFVAGVAIAGDLIALLTTFLNGEELTTAFLLKVLVIFLVAAGVFMHFIADLKGYWDMFPLRKRSVGIGVVVLAVVAIVSGFFIVGTPGQARLARLDTEKVGHLQELQSRVINYWQAKQKLPTALTDMSDPLTYGSLPVDPQTGASYAYRATGKMTFDLCAKFNAESRVNYAQSMPVPAGIKGVQDSWQHGSGDVCFSRTIDPSFYPPLK